jgi:hypothetical protein
MCAEASTVLRAVAEDFFFNCSYLEIPSGIIPFLLPYTVQVSRQHIYERHAVNYQFNNLIAFSE